MIRRLVGNVVGRVVSSFFRSIQPKISQEAYREALKIFKEVEELQKRNTLDDLKEAHRLLNELGNKYPFTSDLARNHRVEVGVALADAIRREERSNQPKP